MSVQEIPPEFIPYLLGQKFDYSSHQPSIIRINIFIISLIAVTTALRFWVRFHMLRSAGLDDIFMILALVFALLQSASCLIGYHFGLGKHIWNLSPTDLAALPGAVGQITKSLYGAYLSYSAALSFTKFSILATYFRIFSTSAPLKKTVLVTGALVLGMWICSLFAIIFTCRPVSAAWDYTIVGAKCYPVVDFFYASGAFNIATDVLLCVLPLQTLWALSMPRPQRLVLCVLFSMGTFACVASIIRLTQLNQLTGIDVSYQTVTSLNWSVIEVGTAITCASLSSLRPLASRILPKLFDLTQHPSVHTGSTNFHPRSWTKGSLNASAQRSMGDDRGRGDLKGPVSRFGESRKHSMGEIIVEQTFHMQEMKQLPLTPIEPDEMGMANGRGKEGLWTRTDGLFERSSEEELVGFPRPARRK